jgi:hypothetical protein
MVIRNNWIVIGEGTFDQHIAAIERQLKILREARETGMRLESATGEKNISSRIREQKSIPLLIDFKGSTEAQVTNVHERSIEGAKLVEFPRNRVKKIMTDRARRAARRIGWRVSKSRRRQQANNQGGLRLVDQAGGVIDGVNYELTPEEVIYVCSEE